MGITTFVCQEFPEYHPNLMPTDESFNLDQTRQPSLLRRLAAIGYDAVLVFGVLLLLWTLYYLALVALTGREDLGDTLLARLYWPFALLAMIGFHAWFWSHGGQTLGMKSWRIRVVAADGRDPTLKQAIVRYLWAWISAAACGLGFLWVLIDRQQLAWHDRLSNTRLVMTVKRDKKPGLADAS